MLMRQVPIRIRYGFRFEEIFILEMRIASPHSRNINPAINIYPCDVNSLWTKISRQRLREPAHREFCRAKRDRTGTGLDSRGRARKQHHTLSASDHRGSDLFCAQESAECIDAPGCFELLGSDLGNTAPNSTSGVI